MRWLLACWLAAWWWCLGLVLGAFTNAWMHRLTGDSWGAPFVALVPALSRRMPWLLLSVHDPCSWTETDARWPTLIWPWKAWRGSSMYSALSPRRPR